MNFSNSLIQWYLQSKRDLPWRKTTNPYLIWLSEIMLQQTRVAQGLPYFLTFVDAFPTVFDLAQADEEKVLKLWQGLGYYSRARNLHATAQYIAFERNGEFPENYDGLLKLKGVGEYTAAAIASIAYGEPVPVVDGNVFRVLARYFDVETDISLPVAKKEFWALAAELLPVDKASLFNQAMMEFGALQCVPKNPDCTICVLNDGCAALQKKKIASLPVKLKKTKVTNRYLNYIILKDVEGRTKVQKREDKGIWYGLYEFPLIETKLDAAQELLPELIVRLDGIAEKSKLENVRLLNREVVVHKLSHQHLHIHFWELKIDKKLPDGLSFDEIEKLPFPIVIYNFITEYVKK
ncbi:A/G-specific adenine glycosylase [Flavobacterium cerinum]|uniref:Adenine DNA glycosylase n=1 Tax=Flavobacterium cerinum TaxID=2502784 RepID=A0ABY5IUV2_9FLAO|nr:A/G-specific adenine glycosylase [Flavobacterium cerinum]UUC46605.1 A/G-specific adenine glycosylase [Flavobacterium cerinum]